MAASNAVAGRNEVSTQDISRILIATDGSGSSRHAVELGVELAAAEDAEVTFLHVVPPVEFRAGRMSLPAVPRRLSTTDDGALEGAAAAAGAHGVRFHLELIAGEIGETIVACGDAFDVDLIVVGERARRHWLSVNVPRWVARHATRAVLVARAADRERLAA